MSERLSMREQVYLRANGHLPPPAQLADAPAVPPPPSVVNPPARPRRHRLLSVAAAVLMAVSVIGWLADRAPHDVYKPA